jgi:hypothetical protein
VKAAWGTNPNYFVIEEQKLPGKASKTSTFFLEMEKQNRVAIDPRSRRANKRD